jgi:DHA1 family bicyclomycin/chloramphenicol resistance-like MFS transporter
MGLIGANATTIAMNAISGSSGSVTAVGGFLRFSAGALVGVVMGVIHTESPWALVLVMAISMGAALLLYLLQPADPVSLAVKASADIELDTFR